MVLRDPAPIVGVSSLANYSVIISLMPWAAGPDYFVVQSEVNQAIIEQFAQKKISIPLPQREVRLIGKES